MKERMNRLEEGIKVWTHASTFGEGKTLAYEATSERKDGEKTKHCRQCIAMLVALAFAPNAPALAMFHAFEPLADVSVAIGSQEDTETVVETVAPTASVLAAVGIDAHTLAMPFIVVEVAFVLLSGGEREDAKPLSLANSQRH